MFLVWTPRSKFTRYCDPLKTHTHVQINKVAKAEDPFPQALQSTFESGPMRAFLSLSSLRRVQLCLEFVFSPPSLLVSLPPAS